MPHSSVSSSLWLPEGLPLCAHTPPTLEFDLIFEPSRTIVTATLQAARSLRVGGSDARCGLRSPAHARQRIFGAEVLCRRPDHHAGDYNRGTHQKLQSEGRRLLDHPLPRRLGWPSRFDGTGNSLSTPPGQRVSSSCATSGR